VCLPILIPQKGRKIGWPAGGRGVCSLFLGFPVATSAVLVLVFSLWGKQETEHEQEHEHGRPGNQETPRREAISPGRRRLDTPARVGL